MFGRKLYIQFSILLSVNMRNIFWTYLRNFDENFESNNVAYDTMSTYYTHKQAQSVYGLCKRKNKTPNIMLI